MTFHIDSIPKIFAEKYRKTPVTWHPTPSDCGTYYLSATFGATDPSEPNGRGGLRSYHQLILKYRFYLDVPSSSIGLGPVVVLHRFESSASQSSSAPPADDFPSRRLVAIQSNGSWAGTIPAHTDVQEDSNPTGYGFDMTGVIPNPIYPYGPYTPQPPINLPPIKNTRLMTRDDIQVHQGLVFPVDFAPKGEPTKEKITLNMAVDTTMLQSWAKSTNKALEIGAQDDESMQPATKPPFLANVKSAYQRVTLKVPQLEDEPDEEIRLILRIQEEPDVPSHYVSAVLSAIPGDGGLALGYNEELVKSKDESHAESELCKSLAQKSKSVFLHLGPLCVAPSYYDKEVQEREQKKMERVESEFVVIKTQACAPFLAFLSMEDDVFSMDPETRWVTTVSDNVIRQSYQSLGMDLWLATFPHLVLYTAEDKKRKKRTGKWIMCPKFNLATFDSTTPLILLDSEICGQIYSTIPGARCAPCLQSWIFPLSTDFSPRSGPRKHTAVVEFKLGTDREADVYDNVDKEVGVTFTMSLIDLAYDLVCPQMAKLSPKDEGLGKWFYGTIQSRGDLPFDVFGLMALKEYGMLFDYENGRIGFVKTDRLAERNY